MQGAADAPAEYCRAIESYLCRKNDGHLIRIVGPSFERVCGWAARGVPLKVAFAGIDRYFERYYAKGPKRRPVQIDFCDADVLDAFDEWRRAVGLSGAGLSADLSAGASAKVEAQRAKADGEGAAGAEGEDDAATRRKESLPAHLERAIARLTALRAGPDRQLDAVLDSTIRELDAARGSARSVRGQARAHMLERLSALDAEVLAAGRATLDQSAIAELTRDADEELAAFRSRMAPEAYARARAACVDRLVRERLRLPMLTLNR